MMKKRERKHLERETSKWENGEEEKTKEGRELKDK